MRRNSDLEAGRDVTEERLGVRESVRLAIETTGKAHVGRETVGTLCLANELEHLLRIERSVFAQMERHVARVGLATEHAQATELRLQGHELYEPSRLFGRRTETLLHL